MWTKFDVAKPPKRWCLVRFRALRIVDNRRLRSRSDAQDGRTVGKIAGDLSEERGFAVVARWSERAHCWIDHDLQTIANSSVEVESYIETPYETIFALFAGMSVPESKED